MLHKYILCGLSPLFYIFPGFDATTDNVDRMKFEQVFITSLSTTKKRDHVPIFFGKFTQ